MEVIMYGTKTYIMIVDRIKPEPSIYILLDIRSETRRKAVYYCLNRYKVTIKQFLAWNGIKVETPKKVVKFFDILYKLDFRNRKIRTIISNMISGKYGIDKCIKLLMPYAIINTLN